MSVDNFKNLELDYRMYQYLRNSAITNLYDALLELITNSIDAYSNFNSTKQINIFFDSTNRNIKVIDQAIGLDAILMEKAFLTVGTYLSNDEKRGHFSRGAKDISAIGDITFTAIKDNKISQCKILSNGTGAMIIKNKLVTNSERLQYKINKNGLHVNLDLISTIDLNINWDKLVNHYALRDILKDSNVNIILETNNDTRQLKYNQKNNLEKIVSVEYQVPYYNVSAKFEVFLDKKGTLQLDNNQRFSENGFLIKSFNTIYENSTLNNRFISRHPKFYMLSGTLECDYLNTLLKDYENNGPSEKNPFPIIDTSRLSGINKQHPFTKHLMRLPQERVLHILSELLYEGENKNNNKINLSELLASLHDLQILGSEIFDKLNVELLSDFYFSGNKLGPSKDGEITLNDVQHSGKEQPLRFSKQRINRRRKKQRESLQEMLRTGAKLDINFVDKNFIGKYNTNISNQGIFIDIPLENSVVKRYLGTKEEDYPGRNDTRFLVSLADIITESFADILADNDQASLNTTGMTNQEIIDNYNSNNNKYYDLYEEKVFDIILG